DLSCRLVRSQDLRIEQAGGWQSIDLKTDFRQAQAPSFQPGSQYSFLLGVTVEHEHDVDVAARPGLTGLCAPVQVNGMHAEPVGIDACRKTFGNTLSPSPVLRSSTEPLATQFALLPFEIFAETVRNVVEQLSLFVKKGSLPRVWLCGFVEHLDGANRGAP